MLRNEVSCNSISPFIFVVATPQRLAFEAKKCRLRE